MAGLLPITPIALTCYSISNLFYKYLLPGQERPHLPHNLKYSYDVKHFQSDQSWSCGVTKVDLEVVWLKTSSSSFPPSSLCRRPVEQVGGLPSRGEAGKENPSGIKVIMWRSWEGKNHQDQFCITALCLSQLSRRILSESVQIAKGEYKDYLVG